MPRESKDEGPKLREERLLQDLYPDLTKDYVLPVVCCKSSDETMDQVVPSFQLTSTSNKKQFKQLIFEGNVTLEEINLHHHRADYKHTPISLNELGGSHEPSKKVSKKALLGSSSSTKFNDKKVAYLNRLQQRIPKYRSLKTLVSLQTEFQAVRPEYDMDEQDDLYLKHLNEKYCDGKLTHDLFEELMTILEYEWMILDKKIPPRSLAPNTATADHQSQTAKIHYELYGSDDGTSNEGEQGCAVCGGIESTLSNAIVFCDGCDVAVHQECYGIIFIPEGQWLCRVCFVSKNRKVNCLFCPSNTGAFKQTENGSWAHVVCALWIPELYFANLNYMEPIEGVKHINKSRWKLNCHICYQKMGACIQCSNKNCFTAYHVTCAKRASLYMSFEDIPVSNIAQNQFPPDETLISYCHKHTPFTNEEEKQGIIKTRRYFNNILRNNEEVKADVQEEESEKQLSFSNETRMKKWKSNRGTPIAPQLFADIIEVIIRQNGLENSVLVSQEVCKYWSMKRELKRGAPLIRKVDTSTYSSLNADSLKERQQFTQVLLNDLSRIKILCQLVKQRAEIENSLLVATKQLKKISRSSEGCYLNEILIPNFINSNPYRVIKAHLKDDKSLKVFELLHDKNFTSISQFEKTMTDYFDSVANDDSVTRLVSKSLIEAKNYIFQSLANGRSINLNEKFEESFMFDFEKDQTIKERPWNGPVTMKYENLSDVEDLTIREERFLHHCIHK